jgi:hypothetical protein
MPDRLPDVARWNRPGRSIPIAPALANTPARDLFVPNPAGIARGINEGVANAVLIGTEPDR